MGAEKGAKCGDSGFSKVIVFDKFFSATLFITVAGQYLAYSVQRKYTGVFCLCV